MPLSNCSECHYYTKPIHAKDIACSVSPAYASMWHKLKGLDSSTLNCLPVDNCRDFEAHPDLEPVAITLNLKPKQWRDLARNCPIPQLIEAVKPHVDLDSYIWIEVDSSCMQAVAYNPFHTILKIHFNSGSIYQYQGISEESFEELLNSSSKGRYFNEYIKDIYLCELIGY